MDYLLILGKRRGFFRYYFVDDDYYFYFFYGYYGYYNGYGMYYNFNFFIFRLFLSREFKYF